MDTRDIQSQKTRRLVPPLHENARRSEATDHGHTANHGKEQPYIERPRVYERKRRKPGGLGGARRHARCACGRSDLEVYEAC